MAPVSGVAFRRLVRTLDEDAFGAFVADLWRVRGWAVDRDGGTLVVERPRDGDRRTVAIRAVPWWRPGRPSPGAAEADAVVTNRVASSHADSLIDAGDLHDMLRYSVDPGTGAALFEAHLDPSRSTLRRAALSATRPTRRQIGTAALVLAVLIAAAAAVAVLPGAERARGPAETSGGDPSASTGVYPDYPDDLAATGWPTDANGYPPGLDGDGVTDPAVLAEAHAGRVAGRTRVVTLTVVTNEDGRRRGTYVERIAVRDGDTFVTDVEARGNLHGAPPVLTSVEVYADDGVAINFVSNMTERPEDDFWHPPREPSDVTRRIQPLLERALSVDNATVVVTFERDGELFHRVSGARSPGPDLEFENVSALVARDGTVHALRYAYELPAGDGSVVVTVEYAFGDVAVERPAWAGSDRETDGMAVPTSRGAYPSVRR